MARTLRIALAGNPNAGKTTIFNDLTGSRQHVANYAGVTVEKKEGTARSGGYELHVTDLPGTYSLTAYSLEEVVARDFIIKERPDVVIDVVDASNLERNLYLTVQLMELGVPIVLALNMMDLATRQGLKIDSDKLSMLLGVPIVSTVGTQGKGLQELLSMAVSAATAAEPPRPATVRYGLEVEEEVVKVAAALAGRPALLPEYPRRWLATKLLESDDAIVERLGASGEADGLMPLVEKSRAHIRAMAGDEAEIVLADRRYGFISGACSESVVSTVEARHIMSDRIDTIVTNRALGIPILLALMYAIFYAAFELASAPGSWIGAGLGMLGDWLSTVLPAGANEALSVRSLVVEGIIGGVGSVIAFLPNVMVLFLAIAILEDSGYMARAAFVMDTLMHRMGLHGKSFIPMIIGFGCSVPAIMATRTIENRRGRLTTMMVVPLMSCGARLPVYALLIPAFFRPSLHAPILWLIYVLGVGLAVGLAKVLRVTVFRGESHPLVMELPPYRMPTLRGLFIHTWERSWLYVKKAGTVILAVAVLMWFLCNWPAPPNEAVKGIRDPDQVHAIALQHSVVGRIGKAVEPVLEPLGFDWRVGTALVGATAAKEVFVAQMGIVFGAGEAADTGAKLRQALRANYSTLAGFAMLIYMLIASPCVATSAVTKRESGSWKWAALQWAGLTAVGYVAALLVYQVGSLLRIGIGG